MDDEYLFPKPPLAPTQENDATRGMTLREIVLEIREKVDEQQNALQAIAARNSTFITRAELWTTLFSVIGLGLAIFKIF